MLLISNVLIADQTTVIVSNDFEIRDGNGNVVGSIRTAGDLATRMVVGSRQYDVYDGDQMCLRVNDPPNIGQNRLEIRFPDGQPLASVTELFGTLQQAMMVDVVDGTRLEVRGDWKAANVAIDGPGGRLAHVQRGTLAGSTWITRRSRYIITFADQAPPHLRQVVIGCVVAIARREPGNLKIDLSLFS